MEEKEKGKTGPICPKDKDLSKKILPGKLNMRHR
jgi:hypothetical protein